jgi:hypothetical protein
VFVKGPIASGAAYIQLCPSPFRELQKVTMTPTDPVDMASSKFADFLCFAIYSASPLRQGLQADPRETWRDLHPDVTLMALWEKADQTVSDLCNGSHGSTRVGVSSNRLLDILSDYHVNRTSLMSMETSSGSKCG